MPVFGNLLLSILLLKGAVKLAKSLEFPDLPNLMNEHELSYYFGSDHREELPLFELFSPSSEPLFPAGSRNTIGGKQSAVLKIPFQSNTFSLNLRARTNLVTRKTKFVTRNENGSSEEYLHRSTNDCHYLHVDHESSAAVTSCDFQNFVSISSNFYVNIIDVTRGASGPR